MELCSPAYERLKTRRDAATNAGIGHNPGADEAERIRFRETFNLHDHLRGTPPHPSEKPVVHITREQVLELCRSYGIEVIAQSAPGMGGGRMQSLEEKAARVDALTEENVRLRSLNAKLVERVNRAENKTSEAS